MNLTKINDYCWEIPREGKMRVNGRIYANNRLLKHITKDKAIQQVCNVATLPGIVGHSLAMPDMHEGYGFPIGGVAAMDVNSGVISPGGVGYDINCGVRLIRTNLCYSKNKHINNDLIRINRKQLQLIADLLYNTIPTGLGSQGAIKKLSQNNLKDIMRDGVDWAITNGYGSERDKEYCEENGCIREADPSVLSYQALKRGQNQMGTLGSGNHFIELGRVQNVFDERVANIFGLEEGQVTLLIHSGSRGLGHQVCGDYIKIMKKEYNKNTYPELTDIPDMQLICVPINSAIGIDYYAAMSSAANYAWVNRQVMMSLAEEALQKSLNLSPSDLRFTLIYDICHNIAKFETHQINGENKKLCVHRKGATRAFPPYHPSIPQKYQDVGQPVIIPGDMGRYSYLCLGTKQAMQETFGSSCHGAGRVLSRKQAKRNTTPEDVIKEMNQKEILIHSATRSTLSEEMSSAYKDVDDVVETMNKCGLLTNVVKLNPLAVIKG